MTEANEYPDRPVPAVGAIVVRGSDVLLVKRGREPNRGRWSVPGGALEPGETVEGAAVREVAEETSVNVRPDRIGGVRDYIVRESTGRVRWHYVLIDVVCAFVRGEPTPASDAEDARFVAFRELGELDLTPTARKAIDEALRTPRS